MLLSYKKLARNRWTAANLEWFILECIFIAYCYFRKSLYY